MIMKKCIAMALVAGFVTSAGLAFATTPTTAVEAAVERPNTVAVESNLEKIQDTFSGLVTKAETGLILETGDGIYKLKGLSLEEIVGKEVSVTGVVSNNEEGNTIYVVRADVKA